MVVLLLLTEGFLVYFLQKNKQLWIKTIHANFHISAASTMEHTTVEHKLMINILRTEMDAALFFAKTGWTWCSLLLRTHFTVQVSLWKIPQTELRSPSTLPSQWEHFHLNNTSNMNWDIFCVTLPAYDITTQT